MHNFIEDKMEIQLPPLDRKSRSEIRKRNKELINTWRSQAKNQQLTKSQRGLVWRKVALMNTLESAYSRPFTEAQVIEKLNVSWNRWIKLSPYNLGLVGHPVMAGLIELYYTAEWFPVLMRFMDIRKKMQLACRAAAFYRAMLGSSFMVTNYSKEEFVEAITPKFKRMILAQMLRDKALKRYVAMFPDTGLGL
jgi:hypothetical protein